MKKSNVNSISDLLKRKTLIRWSTVVIHLLAVPCMDVRTAASLNLFHSVVTVVSALPAETNILWNVLLPCPLSWLMSNTAIVSLRLMKIFVTFSWETVLCSTTFSTLLPVSFHICSSKWTSQKLYTWFYYGSPYFWQGFKMESTYSLSHIRRWTQRWWVLASSPSLQLHLSA